MPRATQQPPSSLTSSAHPREKNTHNSRSDAISTSLSAGGRRALEVWDPEKPYKVPCIEAEVPAGNGSMFWTRLAGWDHVYKTTTRASRPITSSTTRSNVCIFKTARA
eukprot:2635525-Prymnesium_polylepis.1